MDNIDKFVQLVQESDNIVFFGGAGVSTESGIPDFRSPDGLYNQKYKYPPETIISHSFYQRYPEEFYRFYKDKMLYPDAKPGITHLALAKLEKEGKLKAVITQNIDGLHQKATKTAASVPRWSTSESTSAASPLTPVTCWTTDRCPELETGRNSVSPCTTA